MSIWVLHAAIPAVSEGGAPLALPLSLPVDVTDATSFPELRARLKSLEPDQPPEQLNRLAERVWRFTHALGREDILALPLPDLTVAFAEITGPARYDAPHYVLPVRFFSQRAPLHRFRRHPMLFAGTEELREVHDGAARALIRDCLPLAGNRFRRLKWILMVIAVLQFSFFALHFWQRMAQRGM